MKRGRSWAGRSVRTLIFASCIALTTNVFSQDIGDSEEPSAGFDGGGSSGSGFDSGSGDSGVSFDEGGDSDFAFDSGSGDSDFGFDEGGEASGFGLGFEENSGDGGFGFGFDEGGGFAVAAADFSVTLGGSVSAGITGFVHDWSDASKTALGNIFSGTIDLSAQSAYAEALIKVKIAPDFTQTPAVFPISLDEAYLRAYFGDFDLEAGVRKLTWGKADSMGPLDVINPLDYSDLSIMSNPVRMKIARPLIHLSYNLGSFTKVEAVFVPWFAGHRFATDGRWQAAQMRELSPLISALQAGNPAAITQPATESIDYAQAGARFTTTVASTDLGIQYYWGLLPKPAARITLGFYPTYPTVVPLSLAYKYNRFHQIGVDYAQVVAGFNLRAEFAAHFTDDMSGDKPDVYNPFLAWSLGFDRDLVWGINLNLQGLGTIRLFNDKIGDNPLAPDIEAGSTASTSRITANLSKKFLRDELELKVAVAWGIEDSDLLVMPALVWTRDDLALELSGGIFGGDKDGELGQYRDNSFVYAGLTYSF